MLLRRIREHAGKHNWFAVAIDLAIVVLGVFLGMQVTNWNEARLDHDKGEAYRARIVTDLASNVRDLEARAGYYRSVKHFAEETLADLDGEKRLSDAQFLIDAYQATQIYPRPVSRFTYDEMMAVGALDTIANVDERERISNYYISVETSEVSFKGVMPYRDAARRAIPYRVQQRIRTQCAESLEIEHAGLGLLSLPEHCDLGLSAAELGRAAARVRATPGLELDLTRHLADLDQKLIQVERLKQRAERLSAEMTGRPIPSQGTN
ncbi:MAG TPA: hypothetical protein VG841_06475 [Caulobacterales bacterium]|nr:hypothetical protein [Caulobacterales bacterium]